MLQRVWSAARKNPDKVILRDTHHTWTWRELLWRAQAYANALSNSDAEFSTKIVPILVDRNGDTVAAILGSLISGRGFSPLSPQQPAARLAQCFSALNANILIAQAELKLPNDGTEKFPERLLPDKLHAQEGLPRQPQDVDLKQILYVMFTSGSTGIPKGVMVDYSNIDNAMLWSLDTLDWRPDDVIGCCTNFYFDLSMFDVFTMLYFDVPLAIFSNLADAATVVLETALFGVTSMFGVPTFFSNLLRRGMLEDRRLASLRRVIAGGDFFPPSHLLGWIEVRPDIEIFNIWGPTETTIVNTMHKVTADDLTLLKEGKYLSVGKAHERMQFYLVDESLNEVRRANKHAEICMLGDCVTRGYLNDSELTKKFYIELNGKRAFRTQDIGYVDSTGNLFIVGRIGAMVKVAGYRVDLGEIESATALIEDIHSSCAFVVETDPNSGDRDIWLAVVPKSIDSELNIYLIKKNLRLLLPIYMVPKRVIVLSDMPLNANGKVDRAKLILKAKKELAASS